LGGDDVLRADRDAMFGGLQIDVFQNAVIYFGLGTQNFPFVEFLLALFSRLTAGVFVGFPLLRNKANFGFLLVGPKL
jgi:hypothetical protein